MHSDSTTGYQHGTLYLPQVYTLNYQASSHGSKAFQPKCTNVVSNRSRTGGLLIELDLDEYYCSQRGNRIRRQQRIHDRSHGTRLSNLLLRGHVGERKPNASRWNEYLQLLGQCDEYGLDVRYNIIYVGKTYDKRNSYTTTKRRCDRDPE